MSKVFWIDFKNGDDVKGNGTYEKPYKSYKNIEDVADDFYFFSCNKDEFIIIKALISERYHQLKREYPNVNIVMFRKIEELYKNFNKEEE